MTLTDTRPIVTAQRRVEAYQPDAVGPTAGELLAALLAEWPDVDLPTVRVSFDYIGEHDRFVCITGRRGTIADAECPSCHSVAGRPCTEYCELAR